MSVLSVSERTPQELQALLKRQQAGRWAAASRSAGQRRQLLTRLGEAVKSRRAGLAEALRADLGKSRAEAEITELHPLLAEIRFAQRHLNRWMRPQMVSSVLSLGAGHSEISYQPRGNTLILSPWNYPINLSLVPLIGALAAGNTAVLKPSEKAPATARALSALIAEIFAPELVSVVEGGPEVSRALTKLPFDHIFFTGSPAVGREVMAAAAATLASVTLELGGKSPALVDKSADLELAATRIAWGKFLNAGQTCIAPDYVLAHESVVDALAAQLVAAIERLYGGPIWQRRGPDYGRMVDAGSVARLQRATQGSLAAGASLRYGGVFEESARYISPTLISNVRPDMALMREELFGPVLPILSYRTLDEALTLIQQLEQPLALYFLGRDGAALSRIRNESSSGSLVINGTVIQFVQPHLPFGGVGHSGQGHYHGEYSFRAFSHQRAVLREPAVSPVASLYPPYGRALPRLTAWALRTLSE